MKKLAILATALSLLAGCAVVPTEAPAGAFQTEADFTVTLGSDWSRWPSQINPATSGEFLTQDGMLLNRLHFITVADGEGFVRVARGQELPLYAAGGSEFDIVDMVTQSLEMVGYNSVEAMDIRPAMIDGQDGLRFGLTGNWTNGLHVRGEVAALPTGDDLHLIFFMAPERHYYDRLAGEVEQIMSSMDVTAD